MIGRLLTVLLAVAVGAVGAHAQSDPGAAPTPHADAAVRKPRSSATAPEARVVIENALAWLARHQEQDGCWSPVRFDTLCAGDAVCDGKGAEDYQVGLTGLVTLALLGYGAAPGRELVVKDEMLGNAANLSLAADRSLRWLCGQQRPDGVVGNPRSMKLIYNQAVAAYALVEGYILTGDVALRDAAQKAVDFLVAARNPGKAWRYTSRSGENDSSATGWCVSALYFARLAGLAVPADAFAGARAFLVESTNDEGMTGYQSVRDAGVKVVVMNKNEDFAFHHTASAIALFARHLVEGKKLDARYRQAAVKLLTDDPPSWDVGKRVIDYYYWYHAAEAMHQASAAPAAAKAWQKSLVAALTLGQGQDRKSCTFGSWSADTANGFGRWAFEAGRVYSTAIAVLALETPFRYAALPALDSVPDTGGVTGSADGPSDPPPGLAPLTDEERALVEDWVVGIGGPATETVEADILAFGPRAAVVVRERLRDTDPTVRRRVRELLAKLGVGAADPDGSPAPDPLLPPEYATPHTKYMDRYKEDLKSGDVTIRERAVGALAGLKSTYPIEPLLTALLAEEQGLLRTRMVEALLALDRTTVSREARKLANARMGSDPALRLMDLLHRADDVEAQRCSVMLFLHPDKGVSAEAAKALRDNHKNAVPVVLEAARGSQGAAKRVFVGLLGEIGDARAVPYLCSLCQSDPAVNPDRDAAIGALVAIGLPGAPAMIDALSTANRKRVIGALQEVTREYFEDDQIAQWKGWLKEHRKEIEEAERARFPPDGR